MEAPTSSDNSEPACQFSSLLLPFIESVLLNCSTSLLSRIAVQIKTQSPVLPVQKNYCLTTAYYLPFGLLFPWVLLWQLFLLTAKILSSEKQ